jgi:hypothetical protein
MLECAYTLQISTTRNQPEQKMITSQKELFAVKFADCMARLKAFGLKGDVAVTAGIVMVSTTDKGSAQGFRKAIKTACARTGLVSCETRPAKGAYVFTIAC